MVLCVLCCLSLVAWSAQQNDSFPSSLVLYSRLSAKQQRINRLLQTHRDDCGPLCLLPGAPRLCAPEGHTEKKHELPPWPHHCVISSGSSGPASSPEPLRCEERGRGVWYCQQKKIRAFSSLPSKTSPT